MPFRYRVKCVEEHETKVEFDSEEELDKDKLELVAAEVKERVGVAIPLSFSCEVLECKEIDDVDYPIDDILAEIEKKEKDNGCKAG
jgi:hypothetical protein